MEMINYKPFLRTVAEDLMQKTDGNTDLSRFTVVFPNKRASLFFNKHLYEVYSEKYGKDVAVWSPKVTSISDLFRRFSLQQNSNLKILSKTESLELIFNLYLSYVDVYGKHVDELSEKGIECMPMEQTFDEFYFFGELLLADFDDVDKNLVQTEKLFRNYKDYESLGLDKDYLTDDQKSAVRHFFNVELGSEMFKKFISLWEVMDSLYNDFKSRLAKQNICYEGMLERMVVEKMKDGEFECSDDETFVFVGFNALNACEKTLFKCLDKAKHALFYWDYDNHYFDPKGEADKHRKQFKDDAGTFLRQNLLHDDPNKSNSNATSVFVNLGNESKGENHDFLSRLKSDNKIIRVAASPSNAGMAKYVSTYLKEKKSNGVADDDLAIILCDEKLLLPVLYAIPGSVDKVNITMGFPLTQTPPFTILSLLLDMMVKKSKPTDKHPAAFLFPQVSALLRCGDFKSVVGEIASSFVNYMNTNNKYYLYKEDVDGWLKSTNISGAEILSRLLNYDVDTPLKLVDWLLDILKLHANRYKDDVDSDFEKGQNLVGMYQEATYRVCVVLSQLQRLLNKPENELITERLQIPLLARLIRRMFSTMGVNYSGEPAKGLQIMGFLESRNLDFKHLLILSADDDNMPKSGQNTSYIPYSLRSAFGLPTVEHADALYAYNFYRLLQRPEDIVVAYNSSTAGTGSGEISRFMRQLKFELNAYDGIYSISPDLLTSEDAGGICIQKTDEVISLLKGHYGHDGDRQLSPSALNMYDECSLKFYYKYVMGLDEKEDFDENMDSSTFGNIFHSCMQFIYCDITGQAQPSVKYIKNQGHKNLERAKETADWNVDVDVKQLKSYVSRNNKNQLIYHENNIKSKLDAAFAAEFKTDLSKGLNLTGEQLIKYDVLLKLVKRQLAHDYSYTEKAGKISVLKPEFYVSQPINVPLTDGSVFEFWLGGIIDRRDMKDGILRVVDYKTGNDKDGKDRKTDALSTLFGLDSAGKPQKNEKSKIMQTMLYSLLLRLKPDKYNPAVKDYNPANHDVQPVLMFPLNMLPDKEYEPELNLKIGSGKDKYEKIVFSDSAPKLQEEFLDYLKMVLGRMLDKAVPFVGTEYEDRCKFCSFTKICHKEVKKDY